MKELYKDDMWRIQAESASLPDGRVKHIHRVYGPSTVTMVPVTKEGKILVLHEFRPFYGDFIWMLPSGKIDKEDDPLEAAHRELREETGFAAKSMKKLIESRPTERIAMVNYAFVAEELYKSPLPHDAEEMIEVHALEPEEALKRILESSVVQMPSAGAMLLYLHRQRESNLPI